MATAMVSELYRERLGLAEKKGKKEKKNIKPHLT